jgi:hypothetical protein
LVAASAAYLFLSRRFDAADEESAVRASETAFQSSARVL